VKNGLAKPTIRDGIYTMIAALPYTLRNDPTSIVGAYGLTPPIPLIDPEIMRATLKNIRQDWDWPSTWGWDYPILRMCAARLGQPTDAIGFLLIVTPKNLFLPNGHNRQHPLAFSCSYPATVACSWLSR
jgi:hypothetical protein